MNMLRAFLLRPSSALAAGPSTMRGVDAGTVAGIRQSPTDGRDHPAGWAELRPRAADQIMSCVIQWKPDVDRRHLAPTLR
jgi:hypothetical protein